MHPYVNTAVRAARRAGEIIVRGLARFEGVETASKGLNDFVTSIDHAAEAAIIEILREAYPHHAFLAEESGASGNGDTIWIIDPLDGTTNFMHGFPQFAVSIACQMRRPDGTCGHLRPDAPGTLHRLARRRARTSRTAGCASAASARWKAR